MQVLISVSLGKEAACSFWCEWYETLCHVFAFFSQIATFFSNNLDFFTSSGYSPRGSTAALNPLQAESMLANKKKAAAYMHAVKKVSVGLNLLVISRLRLMTNGDQAFAANPLRLWNILI